MTKDKFNLSGAQFADVTLNDYARNAHLANLRWWFDGKGNRIERNKGELIALIHSELSECLKAFARGSQTATCRIEAQRK